MRREPTPACDSPTLAPAAEKNCLTPAHDYSIACNWLILTFQIRKRHAPNERLADKAQGPSLLHRRRRHSRNHLRTHHGIGVFISPSNAASTSSQQVIRNAVEQTVRRKPPVRTAWYAEHHSTIRCAPPADDGAHAPMTTRIRPHRVCVLPQRQSGQLLGEIGFADTVQMAARSLHSARATSNSVRTFGSIADSLGVFAESTTSCKRAARPALSYVART